MFGFDDESTTVEVLKVSGSTVVKVPDTTNSETTFSSRSTETFIKGVLGNLKAIHHLSRDEIKCPDDYPASTVSLFYQAAHSAFDRHVSLSLSPVMLWYMIVHEVAIYVKQHRDECAHYFTSSLDKKEKIEVRDDSLVYGGMNDWTRSINLIREPLSELIQPDVLDIFLPEFSSMTDEEATAILVSFMDTISEYYEFEWTTMCGIPEVRLEGPLSDWDLLLSSTRELAAMLGEGELSPYFDHLIPVLEKIRETVESGEGDIDFWRSIYKVDDMSGGPYINGWLTAFTAYTPTREGFELREYFDWTEGSGLTTRDFPAHVSVVNFNWNYYEQVIPMSFIAGVLGVQQDDFLTPKLGFGVIERANDN